jgi:hypothetical protein
MFRLTEVSVFALAHHMRKLAVIVVAGVLIALSAAALVKSFSLLEPAKAGQQPGGVCRPAPQRDGNTCSLPRTEVPAPPQ